MLAYQLANFRVCRRSLRLLRKSPGMPVFAVSWPDLLSSSLSLSQFSALNPSMTTVWELAHLHTFFFSRFISSCPPFFMSAMTLVCFGSFSYLARFGCWVVFWQKTTLVYTLFLFSSLSDFLLFPSHSHLIIAWKMQMGSLSILICGASGDHNDCHEFSVLH